MDVLPRGGDEADGPLGTRERATKSVFFFGHADGSGSRRDCLLRNVMWRHGRTRQLQLALSACRFLPADVRRILGALVCRRGKLVSWPGLLVAYSPEGIAPPLLCSSEHLFFLFAFFACCFLSRSACLQRRLIGFFLFYFGLSRLDQAQLQQTGNLWR